MQHQYYTFKEVQEAEFGERFLVRMENEGANQFIKISKYASVVESRDIPELIRDGSNMSDELLNDIFMQCSKKISNRLKYNKEQLQIKKDTEKTRSYFKWWNVFLNNKFS